jgi:hypothetical protein
VTTLRLPAYVEASGNMEATQGARRPDRRPILYGGALTLLLGAVVAAAFVARAIQGAQHAVGATIANEDVSITVSRVDRIVEGNGAPTLIARVILTDRGTDALSYNDVQFVLDGDGGRQAYPASGTCFLVDDPASSCTLTPGAAVASSIVFFLPDGMSDLILRYQPDGMDHIQDFYWYVDG